MAQPFALSSPSRRSHLVAAALACAFVLLLAAGGWSAWQQGWLARWLRAEDPANTALLQVTSQPSGVTISIDGRERGRTPASVAVAPGRHTLSFSGSEIIPSRREVTIGAEGASLSVPLWSRQPRVTHLRPTYPGASIAATAFERDGRLALVIAMPSEGREAWLLDLANGTLTRVGPAGQWAALAVAPDGAQVAYLAASATAAATSGSCRNEVVLEFRSRTAKVTLPGTDATLSPLAIPHERSGRCVPASNRILQPGDKLRDRLRMLSTESSAADDALH
jgi:hypothetical protein